MAECLCSLGHSSPRGKRIWSKCGCKSARKLCSCTWRVVLHRPDLAQPCWSCSRNHKGPSRRTGATASTQPCPQSLSRTQRTPAYGTPLVCASSRTRLSRWNSTCRALRGQTRRGARFLARPFCLSFLSSLLLLSLLKSIYYFKY